MEYMEILNFSKATELIEFFNNNADLIRAERIRKVYQSGACSWSQYKYKKIWNTDESIVIELASYSIVIDYYDISDLKIIIIDNEDFYKGKLMSEDSDYEFIPDEMNMLEEFGCFEHNISELLIERFSHSFEINPSGSEMSEEGGDYFASIIIMMGDVGIYLCAEEAYLDGYMDFSIISRDEIGMIKSGMDGIYERISL